MSKKVLLDKTGSTFPPLPMPQSLILLICTLIYAIAIMLVISLLCFHWFPFMGQLEKAEANRYALYSVAFFCIYLGIVAQQTWGLYEGNGIYTWHKIKAPSKYFEPWRQWVDSNNFPIYAIGVSACLAIGSIIIYVITALSGVPHESFLDIGGKLIAMINVPAFLWILMIFLPSKYRQMKKR